MENCPCGSGHSYQQCCEPFHSGANHAPTAESLMRSRYSAFVKHDIDYIMNTFSEKSRSEVNRDDIQSWAEQSEWMGLTILNTENGQEQDDQGMVEFTAKYQAAGQKVSHHEKSFFEKQDNKWFFVDGQVVQDTVRREGPKVGRNDPCPCGSGKKYKKCCLI